jgi:hypothetical protein
MAIGIVLSVFGLGFFCWLLFTLAVYALPFLAGLSAGLAAFHSGAGLVGALVVGFLVGVTILVLGQIVLANVRTPLIRLFIGLIYTVPAGVAGYQLSFALAGIGMPAGGWQHAFAAAGAIVVGATAFARMALVIPRFGRAGLRGGHSAVSRRLAVAGPDQGVALAIRVIEQVGEDRRGEARVVELREIVAALLRLLRPGSPDLGTPDEDAMAAHVIRLVCVYWNAVLFLRYGLFLFAWRASSLVQDLSRQPRLLPRMLFGARPRPLFG